MDRVFECAFCKRPIEADQEARFNHWHLRCVNYAKEEFPHMKKIFEVMEILERAHP